MINIYIKNSKHYIEVGSTLINFKVLSAFIICSIIIFTGIIRILSYSRGNFISQIIEETLLHYLAYQPESYFSVSFFKIIATPAFTALIYFLFRGLNDKDDDAEQRTIINQWRRINFNSAILRFCLVIMISLCWIPIEIIKFSLKSAFYPYSTLENPLVNSITLAAGGIISFFLMKYLPFKPLIKKRK